MKISFPLATSSWDQVEYDALQRVIGSDRFTMGQEVSEFERYFFKLPISNFSLENKTILAEDLPVFCSE